MLKLMHFLAKGQIKKAFFFFLKYTIKTIRMIIQDRGIAKTSWREREIEWGKELKIKM